MSLLRACDMLHFRQPERASLPRGPVDESVLPMLRRCAAPDEAAMVASRGILALSVRCAGRPKRSRAFRFISAQLGEWSRKLCRAAGDCAKSNSRVYDQVRHRRLLALSNA